MPLPALLLILATLLPLACFMLLLAIGRRMGSPLSGWVATFFAAGAFALTMSAMLCWYSTGQIAGMSWGPGDKPIEMIFKWLPFGPSPVPDRPAIWELNLHIDTLTIAMFNTITLIVVLGHAFSVRYMRDDLRFHRFFLWLQLIYFSMLAFVLAGNLLPILILWYLIALGGYQLVTRLGERPTFAIATISFLTKRVGDAGFLLGMVILLHTFGNASLMQLDRWLWAGGGSVISSRTLEIVGLSLFCGAACRSALFPLHFWLPAASRAPMPVAAIVQSVTLNTPGLYFIARIFPILTPTTKMCIAVVGLLSLTLGAIAALFQRELGRVLAYSTVSQFGLMFMAIGIGSWVGGLFHLVTHAFFKALLLLAAGSVIHAAQGKHDLAEFGGFMRKMPLAAITFAIGMLAMAAAPFTCGYYSSEMILVHAGAFADFSTRETGNGIYWLFFIVPTVVTALTALYAMRCWMLIFWGKPRNPAIFEKSRERTGFWFPLVILAAVSLIGGSRVLGVKQFIVQAMIETENYCNAVAPPSQPAFGGFQHAWPINPQPGASPAIQKFEDTGQMFFDRYAIWQFGVGLLAGLILYWKRSPAITREIPARAKDST